MDTNDSQMLGLSIVDDPNNHHINFEEGSLGGKRLHFDSASSTDNDNDNSLSEFSSKTKRIKIENNSNSVDLVEYNGEELLRPNTCDDLDEGNILGVSPTDAISSVAEDMDEDGYCVLIHHMDIKEPLTNLKKALEEAHNICLDGYDFYLQDTTLLAGHKNLVEQCVQGCGTVQINLQLKIEDDGTKKINIIDVLKPSDSYLLATGHAAFSPDTHVEPDKFDNSNNSDNSNKSDNYEKSDPPHPPEHPPEKNLIRWVVDQNFRANQQRLQIPQDPMEWDVTHVRHWLIWAVRQFNLKGIKLPDWKIPGAMLCSLTLDDFRTRVPQDPSDIFWTHLELLRRCNFVAVMQNPDQVLPSKTGDQQKEMELHKNILRNKEKRKLSLSEGKKPIALMEQNPVSTFTSSAWGSRSGNNGQVQLWQFLLDLLTDKNHRDCIQWLGAEGEFKLLHPERVAKLWGSRKNKPSMNYEKLSRALRYYYDGDMISKVHGKRFVYKFVCDLKQLLGYSAYELNRLVIEAEMRSNNGNDPLEHTIFGNR